MKQTANNQPCTTSRHSREGGNLVNNAQKPNINTLITENLAIWSSSIKSKSRTGRGSNKTYELYGIKKLRELILELAVRGQLVKQDPNDEPASELLKKIKAEKEALIQAGKIKKHKVLPEISEDEKPFELPKGWEFGRLIDMFDVRDGTHDTPKYQSSGYPLITSKNLSSGNLDILNVKFISESDHNKIIERSKVDNGDILFAMIGSIGNPVQVKTDVQFSIKNVGLFKYYNIRLSCPEYLLIYLLFAENIFKEQSSGAVQSFVSLGKLRNFPMALPPLKEQKRIVAKVDKLMALCDKLEQGQHQNIQTHKTLVTTVLTALTNTANQGDFHNAWQRIANHFDTLFTTEHSIDQLKQTILQLAVMGKLVKQDPNDEPASELLKKIATEKEKLIKAGKIKKQKALPEISEEEKPFGLPQGWEWVNLNRVLSKITDGTHHSPPNFENGEYLYITAKNIKYHGIKLSNATYVNKVIHEEIFGRCNPEFGDILYIKDGATTGVTTINNLKRPFSMLSSVALLKCSCGIDNNYLLNCLRSPFFYQNMRKGMTGVAITRVTLKKLNYAIIPLPPLNEQKRIVNKVTQLLKLCDTLKQNLKTQQTTTNRLADVIGRGFVD